MHGIGRIHFLGGGDNGEAFVPAHRHRFGRPDHGGRNLHLTDHFGRKAVQVDHTDAVGRDGALFAFLQLLAVIAGDGQPGIGCNGHEAQSRPQDCRRQETAHRSSLLSYFRCPKRV